MASKDTRSKHEIEIARTLKNMHIGVNQNVGYIGWNAADDTAKKLYGIMQQMIAEEMQKMRSDIDDMVNKRGMYDPDY